MGHFSMEKPPNPGSVLGGNQQASNTRALLGLVAAGLGVTVYPKSLIGFLGSNVVLRPIVHPAFRIPTVLAWKRSNRSNSARHFVEVVKSRPAR